MEAKKNTSLKDIIGKLGPLLALVILCIGLQIATGGKFFAAANISNVLRQVPIVALMAVGMLCVILLGGIDLSAGSLLAIGCMAARLPVRFHPVRRDQRPAADQAAPASPLHRYPRYEEHLPWCCAADFGFCGDRRLPEGNPDHRL